MGVAYVFNVFWLSTSSSHGSLLNVCKLNWKLSFKVISDLSICQRLLTSTCNRPQRNWWINDFYLCYWAELVKIKLQNLQIVMWHLFCQSQLSAADFYHFQYHKIMKECELKLPLFLFKWPFNQWNGRLMWLIVCLFCTYTRYFKLLH